MRIAFLAALLAAASPLHAQFHRLEAVAPLKAESPDWDYLSLDAARNRLFIAARGDGLIVYDVEGRKVVTTLEDTKGANASLPLADFDRLYVINLDGTATVFQLSTLKKLDKIEMGKEADNAFYDPVTKEIAVMRGDAAEVTFLDAASGRIAGRLKMPTKKLEASAADGRGNLFIAIRDRNSVIKLDMRSRSVAAEYPANCEEANGMAIDRANGRLFVGCRGRNPVLSVMDAASGKVVATLGIGRGNDGVIYDADTRRVYASGGVDGNLVVYAQAGPDSYKLVEATTTRPYARTMALHPVTKKVYLVTAEGTVDPSRKVNTGPAPFYPNRFFPGTFTLLTYAPPAPEPASAAASPAECEARVGYDRDRLMSGFILPTAAGPRTCVPFSTVAAYPPPGYKGDFYVDEFSDARMREQWAACKQDPACFARVSKAIKARQPPNREHETKNPRHIYLLGKVAEGPEIDLKAIRRPAFFAADPWKESIAQVDARTWIVEFTAPREPYERIHKQMTDPIKLRGWYIRGDGVDDGKQGRRRALVVMSGGGGTRTTAITDPRDRLYRIDASGKSHYIPVPSETSGASGQHYWRDKAAHFNKAGFDVLLFDRRGVGISGGYSDTNTHQQGRDLLAIVASLRTGEGLRAMSPAGETTKGKAAAESVRGGPSAEGLPVILFGNSRGTMATGWAMTKNFDKDCTLDLPEITCGPALGDRTIKGAILFAEFTSGQGYVMDRPSAEDEERGLGRDRPLFIGGNEVENNLIFFPSSAILAGMHQWPAAFFARGLYDYAASLQGTVDSYNRVKGPKELVVVRGPHPFESWPAEERSRTQERAIAFAVALIQGKTRIEGGRPWTTMKELAATASDVWEESTKPTLVP